MNRFPNISDADKDKLLKLFLISGTYRVDGEKHSFIMYENSKLTNLDPYYGKLILTAMDDLFDPSIFMGRAFLANKEENK